MTADELRLFADDGELRPPGISATVQPEYGVYVRCPECCHHNLHYMGRTYAACERQECGYEWTRSGQLHHTEPLPY